MGPDRGQDTAKSLQENKLPFHSGAEVMLSGSTLKPRMIKQLISALFYCQLLKSHHLHSLRAERYLSSDHTWQPVVLQLRRRFQNRTSGRQMRTRAFGEINMHMHTHREEKAMASCPEHNREMVESHI